MMKLVKPHHIIIPSLIVLVGLLGRFLTRSGMQWYRALALPATVPPSYVFALVWNMIYVMVGIATIKIWSCFKRDAIFWCIIGLLAVNAILNIAWSYFFFYKHQISFALADAVMLDLTIFALICLCWPRSRAVAVLFIPYALWVSFAIIMNWQILMMN